jgi:hypothetical protein
VVGDKRDWKIHVWGSSSLQVVGFLVLTHLVQDHNTQRYKYDICKYYIYRIYKSYRGCNYRKEGAFISTAVCTFL